MPIINGTSICPKCRDESDPPFYRLLKSDYRCIKCYKSGTRAERERRCKRTRPGVQLKELHHYTSSELEQIAQGSLCLPGRSKLAIEHVRSRLGISPPADPGYTADEDTIIKKNYPKLSAVEVSKMLQWRTPKSVEKRARRLGVKSRGKNWRYANRGSCDSGKINSRVTHEQIDFAVPRTYPAQVRQEVVQSLIVQALEGKLSLENLPKAVKKQITSTYVMFPQYGAPISLDAPMYEDGKSTLGDSISSDTFHF
jgi:hypothetical protein